MLQRRDQLIYRLAADEMSAGGPISYDKRQHTVEAVISKGSPVQRDYGVEVLRISPTAVDLSRLREGGIPLLDHHKQDSINSILGRAVDMWFDCGALMGAGHFSQPP